jgi:rhomboid protease GluP
MIDEPIIVISNGIPQITIRRYWPVATYVILGLNIFIFLLMTLAGGSTNSEVLLDFGASYAPYFHRGEYWRAVMPMFLHIGWLHLLVNSYALYILGPILERVYGYGRFALLYVACGVGSSFLSMRMSSNVAAGASGAIFGIAGAMLTTGLLHRYAVPPRWGRAFGRGILPFIVLNLIFGFVIPGIDNWGHIGGLICGLALPVLFSPPGRDRLPGAYEKPPSQTAVAIPVLVVALAMAATANSYWTSRSVTRLLVAGQHLREQNLSEKALERFKEAARRAPRDERPLLHLGSLYLQRGQINEAVQTYREALRLSPELPQAQLGLAASLQRKGEVAEAQQLLEAVIKKTPRTLEGVLMLADLCAEQKLYPEAIQFYDEALRQQPNVAVAHNNLAWLYATSDDPKYKNPRLALAHAQQAVELTGWKEAGFIDTLAEAHYANQNLAEAIRIQTRALELEPHNHEFLEHMDRYRKAAFTI